MTPWVTPRILIYGTEGIGLQFGHGGDAVGDATPCRPLSGRGSLQFGHGGDAVGDAMCQRKLLPFRPSFNSSTAVTPWVTVVVGAAQKTVGVLQFGHGGDAVGDLLSEHKLSDRTDASIRPRR